MSHITLTPEELACAEGRPLDMPVLWRFTPDASDDFCAHDDLADEYVVTAIKDGPSGLIVWGLFTAYRKRPEWVANVSARPVVRRLLKLAGILREEAPE